MLDKTRTDSISAVMTDPVCGMTVEPGKAYGQIYMGTLFNFCSRGCLDKFEADPKKYLKKAGGAGGAS